MLTRAEFIFTIGYDGPAAVIDGQAKRRYGSLSTRDLAEKGLFRAAYASAIWSKDPKDMETVIEIYNKISGSSFSTDAPPDRLFGVYQTNVNKSITL